MRKIVRMTGLVFWVAGGLCCSVISVAVWADDGARQVDTQGAAEREGGPDQALSVPSRSPGASLNPLSEPLGAGAGIESLLRLPSGFVTTSPNAVAGATETEWRRRFKDASSALSEARTTLAATQVELDGVAVGGGANQWSVAPPGSSGQSSPTTSPLSFRLRQQLRGDRERIDSTERAYRELRIQADLAGVPESWRDQPDQRDPPE